MVVVEDEDDSCSELSASRLSELGQRQPVLGGPAPSEQRQDAGCEVGTCVAKAVTTYVQNVSGCGVARLQGNPGDQLGPGPWWTQLAMAVVLPNPAWADTRVSLVCRSWVEEVADPGAVERCLVRGRGMKNLVLSRGLP